MAKEGSVPTLNDAVVGKYLAEVVEDLSFLRDLEMIAGALQKLAVAQAMRVIADHGSAEDRQVAVDFLKRSWC